MRGFLGMIAMMLSMLSESQYIKPDPSCSVLRTIGSVRIAEIVTSLDSRNKNQDPVIEI